MPRSRPQSILSLTYPSSFNETPAICLSNLSRTKHRTSNDSACYRHTMFPSYSRISVPLEIPFRKILLRSGDLEVRAIDLPGRFPDRRNSSNADIASSWNFIHSGPFTPFVIVPFFFSFQCVLSGKFFAAAGFHEACWTSGWSLDLPDKRIRNGAKPLLTGSE